MKNTGIYTEIQRTQGCRKHRDRIRGTQRYIEYRDTWIRITQGYREHRDTENTGIHGENTAIQRTQG